MKSFKQTLLKITSISFALLLTAGCATVTDANVDLKETDEPSVTTTTVDDNDWFSRTGDGGSNH